MLELSSISNRPMLMNEQHLGLLARRLIEFESGRANAEEADRIRAGTRNPFTMVGGAAVIPIIGPIFHRGNAFTEFFGLASTQQLGQRVKQAISNPDVSAVVLDIDSPGGEVDGTVEFAEELRSLRGSKPIIAVSNTLMASAAYWIAAQADVIAVSPSSITGSVGVWTLHLDYSKMLDEIGIKPTFVFAGEHKVDGNPFEPLSESAEADLKAEVDEVHRQFLAAVAKGRKMTPSAVRRFGDGRVFQANRAVELGLADRVATLRDEIDRVNGGGRRRGGRRAQASEHLTAEDVRVLEQFGVDGPEEGDESPEAARYRELVSEGFVSLGSGSPATLHGDEAVRAAEDDDEEEDAEEDEDEGDGVQAVDDDEEATRAAKARDQDRVRLIEILSRDD